MPYIRKYSEQTYLNDDEWTSVRHGLGVSDVVVNVYGAGGFATPDMIRVIDMDTVAVRPMGAGHSARVVVVG